MAILQARELIKITSFSFPFAIPRVELVVDDTKVSISYHFYPIPMDQVRSLIIKDLTGVFVETNIIFSSIKFTTGEYKEVEKGDVNNPNKGPISASFFKPDDAVQARETIQGLMVMYKQNEQPSALSLEDLKKRVIELGKLI